MFDSHCHLSFLQARALAVFRSSVAHAGKQNAVTFLSCTVDSTDYIHAQMRLGGIEGVYTGVGLHPWWVDGNLDRARSQAQSVADCIGVADAIGEIGLDFGPKHIETKESQIEAFRIILEATSRYTDKVLSIHCVSASQTALRLLEQTDVIHRNQVIFHWYSGSSQHLCEILDKGCYIGINPHMLQTKKGVEYIKAIPYRQMLLETDLPQSAGSDLTWADFKVELTKLMIEIAHIRKTSLEQLEIDLAYAQDAIISRLGY